MLARFPGLAWLPATLDFIGECTLLVIDVFRRLLHPPFEAKQWVHQMSFIGVNSVPIVVLTTFSSGAVLALYLAKFLVQYGVGSLAGFHQ